ncbi:MAG: FAD-dependent oxidoreductase [Candidatus Hydrogenedentota bacterium]
MPNRDVVIIGGGPAGITFANQYKRMNPEADIVMFRPEAKSMIYCAIPYAIEGLFDSSKVLKRDELVTDAGVQLFKRSIVGVNFEEQEVIDDAGESHGYRTLFLATGAQPFRPPIPGAEAPNVFTVKTEKDMRDIIARVKKGTKRAIVVGAGAIGIEQAQAYRKNGIETWLIDIASHVLPNMIDEDMAAPLEKELHDLGVRTVLGGRVESMQETASGVDKIHLSTGEDIELDPETDFVCFAIGMKPDIEIFAKAGLAATRDGIIIDSQMRTSIPGVYAAGDCCAFKSAIDGHPVGGKLATAAVPMAKVAARVASGEDEAYPGFYNGAATCVGDWRIGATGFTAATAEEREISPVTGYGQMTTTFPMMPAAQMLKVKIVADQKDFRIIGGQVLSNTFPATDKVDIITLAIQQQMTLRELSKLAYSAQPWQSFFPARNAIVMACEDALGLLGKPAAKDKTSKKAATSVE